MFLKFGLCLLQMQLVVTVFSFQQEDRYNAVKKLLCKEMPCASQCVIARTIKREDKLKRIACNIGLQFVAKLGGQLWEVDIPAKFVRNFSGITHSVITKHDV